MNTEIRSYNLISKVIHWGSALLILGLLAVGMTLENMEKGPEKFELLGLHKSFGVLLLIVLVLRFISRFTNPVDALPELSRKDVIKAKALQGLLYLCMLIMPLSGILMSQAGGHEVALFGLGLPTLMGESKGIHEVLGAVHGITSKVLIVLLLAHIGAALFHHFKLKDDTLKRML